MKNILLLVLIGIVFCSCLPSRQATTYFNENNIEISKTVFHKSLLNRDLIAIQDDSLYRKILTKKEVRGKVNYKESLDSMIEKELNFKLDTTKPTVIIYYIDKDPSNYGGAFVDKRWLKKWKEDLENGLNQIAGIKPLYLYKNFNGLKKHEGIIPWQKDPDNQVAKLFFKHKYPWLSFVVLSKNGDYISLFGEFTLDYVWEATKIMNQ